MGISEQDEQKAVENIIEAAKNGDERAFDALVTLVKGDAWKSYARDVAYALVKYYFVSPNATPTQKQIIWSMKDLVAYRYTEESSKYDEDERKYVATTEYYSEKIIDIINRFLDTIKKQTPS